MRSFLLVLACLLLATPRSPAADIVAYLRDVKPILKERCYACHGPLKQKAKLRLDTAASLLQGGRSGPAAVPGQPEKSLLLARVSAREESERMPPEGAPLTAAQIAVLTEWIRQGARTPAGEKPEEDPRRHWAFIPPVRPPVPAVKNSSWVRNPIDAFVAARREQAGLTPAPPADRATLLRRVYLDLVGLPPTRDELHAFLADTSPDAYEQVVDRLLSSPRYAERWARHWMDVWRYSDWYGSRHINELRNSRRHIWRWRDWIIESLDRDKGYDRMVVEMLAGDEAAPGDLDVQRAGGFLGRNFYVFNRNVWLQDTVEYTGMSLLGLTFKCCRCHDHKYDPLSQQDYYRFRAFFEPHHVRTDPLPGRHDKLKANIAANSPPGSDLKDGLDAVYDANPDAPTYLLERGNEKNPVKDHPLAPGVPGFLGGELRIEPVALPLEAFAPALRPAMLDSLRDEAKAAIQKASSDAARATARAQLAALEARITADLLRQNTHPADPKLQPYAPLGPVYPRTSSGRRLALARWITGRQNPLAARVAVNHIWLRHLGTALVPSVANFGRNGKRPTHPELLDWLAVEFMDHGWSMKHLHRLIVTSNTYRMASAGGEQEEHDRGLDAENRLLWRANVRRMEGEVVRDSLLHLAGRLDVRRGGEDLEPAQDTVIPRRSLYFRHTPDEKPLLLEVFDAANPSECFERTESVVPQQALALANGDFSHANARLIARKLAATAIADGDFVTAGFEQVLCRPPLPEERGRCEAFLRQHAEQLRAGQGLTPGDAATAASVVPPSADPALRARENLVHVLLNYNEFVTVR
jgi:hypothetical protein